MTNQLSEEDKNKILETVAKLQAQTKEAQETPEPQYTPVQLHVGQTPSDSLITMPDGTPIPGIVGAKLVMDTQYNVYILKLDIYSPQIIPAPIK